MKRKKIHHKHLLCALLCAAFVMGFSPALAFALETPNSTVTTIQEESEENTQRQTEDLSTEGAVIDNDCITISSATRLQVATMDLQEHWDGTMEYSTDKINWTLWDGGFIESVEGPDGQHYLYIRGDNNTVVSGGTTWALMKPDKDATIAITGNIETLRGATGDDPADLQMAEDCYGGMFNGDEWLAIAPDMPATSLSEKCYMQMFQNCISLTEAPTLPADTLSRKCYQYMFRGCNGLTTAPELPATNLAPYCYAHMFDSCYYLQDAPTQLPADTMVSNCYEAMFNECIRLKNIPELPAMDLAEGCYAGMFANCFKLENAMDKLPATVLATNCYTGMFSWCWELKNAPELPAQVLAEGCYSEMFLNCYSLTTPADLSKVTIIAKNCCCRMYDNCINLAIYQEAEPGHTKAWKATSATEAVEGWSESMFGETCGDFTDAPIAGETYYIANITPIAHKATAAESEGGYVRINQNYYIPGKSVNVTAVPKEGYVTTAFVARDASANEIPIVNDTFTMPDADVTIIATFKRDLEDCSISGLDESTSYTGTAIEPTVTVTDGDTALTPNVDYTLSYTNNIDAGNATVTITGKGNYDGTVIETFVITKATITITPKAGQSKTYGTKDPVLTFDATGAKGNEVVGTTGSLARAEGETVGNYVMTQGTLALTDHDNFKASNYELKFSETPVYFTIEAAAAKTNVNTAVQTPQNTILAAIVWIALAVCSIAFMVYRRKNH